MKKLLLSGFLVLSCLFMNAQEGLQGTWFAGGQLGFGSTKRNVTISGTDAERKINSFSISPLVGTFVSPDVAVGLAFGYENQKIKVAGEQTSKTNGFIIQPFARKYWNISGGLYFFGQAALPVSFGSEEGANSDSKINTTDIYVALAPGFDYVINSWLTVETSFTVLSAGYSSEKPKGGKTDSSFGFNANSHGNKIGDLTIGIKFLF